MPTPLALSYPAVKTLLAAHAMKQRTESRQFLAWFLENYYRLDEIDVEDCICDGTDDKGIDAICVNENLAQIDIFQSRLATKRTELGDTDLREFFGALVQMSSSESVSLVASSTKNKELSDLIGDKEIGKKVDEGYKVRGVFLTNMKRNKDAILYLRSAPDLILYDEPELQKHYVAIDKTDPIADPITFNVSTKFPFIEYPINPDLKMVIAPLAATELVAMRGIASGELFAWNVRQYLGKKTKVNRDVEISIQTTAEHKYFPAFHNGLTILCKSVDAEKKTITISGYAVVNGCQSLTGLYENKARLTSDLRIMTKFIQIAPDSALARKITDHTNNQNGTTYRDLQSNNLLQTRLQSEIGSRYPGEFYYRIKRGEHLADWPPEKVIENELAARILLAYDLKEPWTCHQTYKLFDELHTRIFGRQEVNGDRIVAVREIYHAAIGRLPIMANEMFSKYGLTKFTLLYLVREALQTDDTGNRLITRPSEFLKEPKGRARLFHVIGEMAQTLVRLLDGEITRRSKPDPFDFKRELKSPNTVRTISGTIIAQYQITVDSKLTPSFGQLWQRSERKRK
jgi:hypothetical protein